MRQTAREISESLGGELVGSGDVIVTGLRSIQHAGPQDLSFVGRAQFVAAARTSRAGVILVARNWSEAVPQTLIRVDDPSAAFQKLALMHAPPPVQFAPGIHPTAVVAVDATLGRDVSVQPYAVIESGAVVGDGAVIGAHAYVGHRVRIGASSLLWPRVVIREGCVIGNRVIIHAGAVIGADGFGYEATPQGPKKIPQIGIVEIEDDVEIGANTTIDRARFDRTLIRQGAKIDNLVQIGHNVIVGRSAIICAQTGISGSCVIGDGAILAGQVGIADHVTIGDGAIILAQSGVHADVPPKSKLFGTMAVDRGLAMRIETLKPKLPELFARVKAIEQKLGLKQKHEREE